MPNYSVYHIEAVSKEEFDSEVNGIEKEIELNATKAYGNDLRLDIKIHALRKYIDHILSCLATYMIFSSIGFGIILVTSIVIVSKYPDIKFLPPIHVALCLMLGGSISMAYSIFRQFNTMCEEYHLFTRDPNEIGKDKTEDANDKEVIPGEDEDWYGTKEDQD